MIIAEILGKLSETSSSVESSEDVLTSNVFQCMRYLKPKYGIIPFLNQVFHDNAVNEQLDLAQEWKVEYNFWPTGLTQKREPDVLIYLHAGEKKYAIVVEAKYHSGPSDREDIEEETNTKYGNQLSDQFIDLMEGKYKIRDKVLHLHCREERCYLLYLTGNNMKPKPEIQAAIEQYKHNSPESRIKIEKHLIWTNWTKVWSVLNGINIDEFPYSLIKRDLISLLDRKGFKEFQGFKIEDWEEKYTPFYKEQRFLYREKYFSFQSKIYDWQEAGFYSELKFKEKI